MENTAMLNSGVHIALNLFGSAEEFIDELLYDNQQESEDNPSLKIHSNPSIWGTGGTHIEVKIINAIIPERYHSLFQAEVMNLDINVYYYNCFLEGNFDVHHVSVNMKFYFKDIIIPLSTESISLSGRFMIFKRVSDINRNKKIAPISGNEPLTFQAFFKKKIS